MTASQATRTVEGWLANSKTPAERADTVRGMLARDEAEDLSGTRPFTVDGIQRYVQRTAAVLGRKLSGSGDNP